VSRLGVQGSEGIVCCFQLELTPWSRREKNANNHKNPNVDVNLSHMNVVVYVETDRRIGVPVTLLGQRLMHGWVASKA